MIAKKTVTLVLGGGSALGLAHIGVLSILEQQFEIKAIVGTSIGAIVGGLYACGLTPPEILAIAGTQSKSRALSPFHLDRRLAGIFNGRFIFEMFKDWTSNLSIEEGRIPFIACAYDLNSRSTILFDSGSYATALRASTSLPMIFSPFSYKNYLLVDGGIEHPLPLAFANLFRSDMVIAVNVLPIVAHSASKIDLLSPEPEKHKRPRRSEVLLQSILHNQGYLALRDTISYEPDIIIEAALPEGRPYAFNKHKAFYEYGRKVCLSTLAEYSEPSFMAKARQNYKNLINKMQLIKDIS